MLNWSQASGRKELEPSSYHPSGCVSLMKGGGNSAGGERKEQELKKEGRESG